MWNLDAPSWEPSPNIHGEEIRTGRGGGNEEGGAARSAAAGEVTGAYAPVDGEALVAVLKQQFPEYSTKVLRELFQQCSGDLSETIDALCKTEMELEGLYMSAGVATVGVRECPGGCQKAVVDAGGRVGDAIGGAVAGSSDPKARKDSSAHAAKTLEEEFPALGSRAGAQRSSVKSPGFQVCSNAGGNYASRAKAAVTLPRASENRNVVYDHRMYSGKGSGSQRNTAQPPPIWNASDQGIRKFDTGETVRIRYQEERSDARDHARLRNQAFQAATQAYVSGNKALAKELGQKGRWHNQMMKECHQRAAHSIFHQRNAANDVSAAGEVPIVDLHGLHVSEATSILGDNLDRLRSRGVEKAHVVVGVGQHGKVPSRLPHAVRGYLTSSGYRFKEVYAGLLEVTIL